jgi:hypothetical protein
MTNTVIDPLIFGYTLLFGVSFLVNGLLLVLRSALLPIFSTIFEFYITQVRKKHLALLSWKPAHCVSTINTHSNGIVHTLPGFPIRIRKFLDLPDPDPLVRGTDPDPDPSIIKQKQ